MADYIVPPLSRKDMTIIKCHRCGALYVPDGKEYYIAGKFRYEPCPICGAQCNDDKNKIPLWKYNMIKWFRGGFNGNKGNQRSDPEQEGV